jgi:4-amino-4-deoxy-L-arabinose transferase-like glycosyltransferase
VRFQNFLFFWLGLNAVRLAVAPLFDLTPQEAYYHLYAENLALSYFDHPPVLAWCLRAFTEVFGKHPTTLRFFAFSASLVTQALWLSLAHKFKPTEWKTNAQWWLATGVVTVTSLISTPDVPLLLFWTLSIHQLWKALFENRQWAFVTAGVAMGLAFDSKYTGIFLQGGFFLFLLLSKTHRPLFRTLWPWLYLAVAHGVMAPVYIWNAQHGFASFLFQTIIHASHKLILYIYFLILLTNLINQFQKNYTVNLYKNAY